MRPLACTRRQIARRGLYVALTILAFGWTIAGGRYVAHADTPTPQATQTIEMTVPGNGEVGPMPNVNEKDLRMVTDNILCQCGCGLVVSACELAMPCGVSKEMKYQAAIYIAPTSEGGQDMTPPEALDQLVKDFGERVLAAPTKKGFNLTAWVLPGVGMGVGMLLVVWALITWKGQQPAEEDISQVTDIGMLSRIENEVKGGF